MMKMNTKMCCGMSCCKHEVKLLKVKDDYVASVSPDILKNFSTPLILITPILSKNYFPFSHFQFSQEDHAPPGKIIDRLSFIKSFLI